MLNQVGDEAARRLRAVTAHGVDLGARCIGLLLQRSVQHTDGATVPPPIQDGGAVIRGRGDQDAVDALPAQHVQIEALLFRVFVGVAEDQRVAGGLGGVLHGAGDGGEEGIGDVAHDQPERMRGAALQSLRQGVRHIAEFGDRRLNAPASGSTDRRIAVEVPRYRDAGHIGQARNIMDRAHRSPCLAICCSTRTRQCQSHAGVETIPRMFANGMPGW